MIRIACSTKSLKEAQYLTEILRGYIHVENLYWDKQLLIDKIQNILKTNKIDVPLLLFYVGVIRTGEVH